ncbi:hypothetical protein T439DRAFT_359283 [Meredithblackwellia eburnea MCA 4105]
MNDPDAILAFIRRQQGQPAQTKGDQQPFEFPDIPDIDSDEDESEGEKQDPSTENTSNKPTRPVPPAPSSPPTSAAEVPPPPPPPPSGETHDDPHTSPTPSPPLDPLSAPAPSSVESMLTQSTLNLILNSALELGTYTLLLIGGYLALLLLRYVLPYPFRFIHFLLRHIEKWTFLLIRLLEYLAYLAFGIMTLLFALLGLAFLWFKWGEWIWDEKIAPFEKRRFVAINTPIVVVLRWAAPWWVSRPGWVVLAILWGWKAVGVWKARSESDSSKNGIEGNRPGPVGVRPQASRRVSEGDEAVSKKTS